VPATSSAMLESSVSAGVSAGAVSADVSAGASVSAGLSSVGALHPTNTNKISISVTIFM